MRLITPVTSLHTSSMLLKRFPRSGFFNFGNKSKAGGLMSGLYGGWGSTCHPYFSKISYTAPGAWGRAIMYDRWPLREIWLQSVSSSISRLRFAEQEPRSLPIRTQCFFTEVWLRTVAKIRTIASSYWPYKHSVQNFWNDLRSLRNIGVFVTYRHGPSSEKTSCIWLLWELIFCTPVIHTQRHF